MKIYDLSHTLDNDTPVYQGTPHPVFKKIASIENDGFRETYLSLTSHTGTHIDAPYHMIGKGKKLDQLPLEIFSGRAAVVHVPADEPIIRKRMILNGSVSLQDIDFLLFFTGWNKYWGSRKYFKNYPVLSPGALELVLANNFKGVVLDTISADKEDSADWKIHNSILGKGMIIIENLHIPEGIPALGDFFCFPLLFNDADGSPVRAVLIT